MRIRTKMISILALLFAVLIVLEIAVQKQVLMPSFAELERDDAKTSMKRIDYALNITLDNLEVAAADWGNWQDVYKFVQAPDPEFVTTNITAVALKQLQVNTLMIVDLTGNVVLASTRDLDSGEPVNMDLAANKELPEHFPWRHNLADGAPAKGIIKTDQGIMMVAGAPILNGS